MERLAWLTDLHLDFLNAVELHTFVNCIKETNPDIILIGGDTATADNLVTYLKYFEEQLQRPIYFVLGNHDYYNGSIAQVRSVAENLSKTSKWLRWLTVEGIVKITETTCLIGHGSWADGRLGNGSASEVELNDYYYIKELIGPSLQIRFKQLAKLGDESAEHFKKLLPQACAQFQNIILLTHVPPFRDACWYEGKISNDEFLPHFACKAVGDILGDIIKRHPQNKLTVLCGHTHSEGEVNILPNLYVKTGAARYGYPNLQGLLNIE